jgi:hypothetical protein
MSIDKPKQVGPSSAFLKATIFFIFSIWFLALTGSGRAEDRGRIIEFSFGWDVRSQSLGSDYQHQYSPPFEPGPAVSSAFHKLQFQTVRAKGKPIFLGIFPTEKLGIEISYFHLSSPWEGQSSDYEVSLQYISRPPPWYEPVEVTVNWKSSWPPPHGYLDLKILNLNPAIRLSLNHRWEVGLSAGLSSFFLKGELGPLAFTRFWLGGHSVLFSEEYKLLARFIPNHRRGWNAGLSFSGCLLKGLSLFFYGRYFRSAEIPLQLEAVGYDENYQPPGVEPLARMIPYLALRPVVFRPSLLSLSLGLKLSLL